MNKHRGSTFDDFLREEGIYEEVHATTLKRIVAAMLVEAMEKERVTKHEMAQRMGTSRSQLDRVLDPSYVTIQLDTLMKAARAVGQNVRVEFEPIAKAAPHVQQDAASARKTATPTKDVPSARKAVAAARKGARPVSTGVASVRKGAASGGKGAGGSRIAARAGRVFRG